MLKTVVATISTISKPPKEKTKLKTKFVFCSISFSGYLLFQDHRNIRFGAAMDKAKCQLLMIADTVEWKMKMSIKDPTSTSWFSHFHVSCSSCTLFRLIICVVCKWITFKTMLAELWIRWEPTSTLNTTKRHFVVDNVMNTQVSNQIRMLSESAIANMTCVVTNLREQRKRNRQWPSCRAEKKVDTAIGTCTSEIGRTAVATTVTWSPDQHFHKCRTPSHHWSQPMHKLSSLLWPRAPQKSSGCVCSAKTPSTAFTASENTPTTQDQNFSESLELIVSERNCSGKPLSHSPTCKPPPVQLSTMQTPLPKKLNLKIP